MKTKKSLSKRFKITKTGKILARKAGKNHFNAKESRNTQMKGKKMRVITLKNKDVSRYLPLAVNR
ncbi:MAG: 50S ribosomal protein L35 [Candidatus Vogelbacteria bacterium]|nr:50S ribosomal protein L35 [Candidatus Vogelbacteria bacterium]